MAEPSITPISPTPGSQGEAIAGNSGAIFTAAEKKIIKEMGGEVDNVRPFLEIVADQESSKSIENEEPPPKQETNVVALDGRFKEHRHMLRMSPVSRHKDTANLVGGETAEIKPPPNIGSSTDEAYKKYDMQKETVTIAKELNINPNELFERFKVEQRDLYTLVHRIRELHLSRILTNSREEFESLSRQIIEETIKGVKTEWVPWLKNELTKLTKLAAEYKIKLHRSLQTIEYDPARSEAIAWLEGILKQS